MGLLEDFIDGLEIIGNYLINFGSNFGRERVLERVSAFGDSIPVTYLHNRSVVDYAAEKQARLDAAKRDTEAQRRSIYAWKKVLDSN